MTLRPAELLAVANEIAGSAAGRRVQKVVQPDERTLLLGLSGAWLLVSVDRRFGRVHLVDEKPPGTGKAATAFCMLLRKELVGMPLAGVEAVAGERALGLDFSVGERRRRLLVFLYGAGARAVLVDEQGRALGLMGTPDRTGAPPELPPPRADGEAGTPGPAAGKDPGRATQRFPLERPSSAIEAFYTRAETEGALEAARTAARSRAKQALERLQRREEALARDLERLGTAGGRRRHADLLLAHLHEVPRGAREVTLADDFEGGTPITIALDPARSAKDNAARMYHDYRRLARGRSQVERRLDETRVARRRAEEHLAVIEAAPAAALPSLAAREKARPSSGRTRIAARPGQAARLPYRVYRSTSGAEILVGKGADKNDELTFQVARGGDLFLHVRDYPGSHVVVPLAGREIDAVTLVDAAMLAVHFSGARPDVSQSDTSAQADVTYAWRKHVRKPRGAPPGRVSIAGGKTLRVRMEPERLRKLLASRTDD